MGMREQLRTASERRDRRHVARLPGVDPLPQRLLQPLQHVRLVASHMLGEECGNGRVAGSVRRRAGVVEQFGDFVGQNQHGSASHPAVTPPSAWALGSTWPASGTRHRRLQCATSTPPRAATCYAE
jgi:hypothetical protein